MESQEKEYLTAASLEIERQALDNPGIGIPVDPDVADFMGAFEYFEDPGDVLAASEGQEDV